MIEKFLYAQSSGVVQSISKVNDRFEVTVVGSVTSRYHSLSLVSVIHKMAINIGDIIGATDTDANFIYANRAGTVQSISKVGDEFEVVIVGDGATAKYHSLSMVSVIQNMTIKVGDIIGVEASEVSCCGGDNSGIASYLIDGGQIVWLQNYDYRVSAANYVILGTRYHSDQTDITLAASDPTYDRIDLVVVDTNGNVVVLTGSPALNPLRPSYDPRTQLPLAFIVVSAGTTSDPCASISNVIYKENLGTPTEWGAVATGPLFNLESLINPCQGLKSIEATKISEGSGELVFTPQAPFPNTNITQVNLYLRSKGDWGNFSLLVLIGTDVLTKDHAVIINGTGTYGFDSTNTFLCQQVSIPIADFNLTAGVDITSIVIFPYKNNGGGNIKTFGFFLDNITLADNCIIVPPGGGPILTANNVLTKNTPTNVQWGGPAIRDTVVDFNGYDIAFQNVIQENGVTKLLAIDGNDNIKWIDKASITPDTDTNFAITNLTQTAARTYAGAGFDYTLNNLGTWRFNMASAKNFGVFNSGDIYLETISGVNSHYMNIFSGGVILNSQNATSGAEIDITPGDITMYSGLSFSFPSFVLNKTAGTRWLTSGLNTTIEGLTNLSSQDRLIGITSSNSRIGYLTIGTGLSLASGVLTNTVTGFTLANGNATTANGSSVDLGGTMTGEVHIAGSNLLTIGNYQGTSDKYVSMQNGVLTVKNNSLGYYADFKVEGDNNYLYNANATDNSVIEQTVNWTIIKNQNVGGTLISRIQLDKSLIQLSQTNGAIYIPNLPNNPIQDRLLGIASSTSRIGYLTLGTGLSLASGVLSNTVTDTHFGNTDLTATANRTHTFGAFTSAITYNSLAGVNGFSLTSNSTLAASNTQILANIALSGVNATATQRTTGLYVSNAHTGTTSTNVGARFASTGGTNNYAILVGANEGWVGIGIDPTSILDVRKPLANLSNVTSGNSGSIFLNQINLNGTVLTGNKSIYAGFQGLYLTLSANQTIVNATDAMSGLAAISFINTSPYTLTIAQGGTTIRALSVNKSQIGFQSFNAGSLITHLANFHVQGIQAVGISGTISNYYGLLIETINANAASLTFTNKWAIYQEGALDRNYLAGDMLLNKLKTGGAAPVTSGSTMMVISDTNGLLSFAAIPTGGSGGIGDMILAATQTNSGQKTFLDGTFKLRNVFNTFSGGFLNNITADRTYTLQDASGTLAFLSDITGTIGGSIAATQVAYGSGANTITGSANFTFDGTVLSLSSAGNTGAFHSAFDNYIAGSVAIGRLTSYGSGFASAMLVVDMSAVTDTQAFKVIDGVNNTFYLTRYGSFGGAGIVYNDTGWGLATSGNHMALIGNEITIVGQSNHIRLQPFGTNYPAGFNVMVGNIANTGQKLQVGGDLYVGTIANATIDTDRFIVSDSGVIKYRTGAEVLADIGGGVPFTTGKVIRVDNTAPYATNTRGTYSKYDQGVPFLTIQGALSASTAGDIIYVAPGTYNENANLNVSYPIYIVYDHVTHTGSGIASALNVSVGNQPVKLIMINSYITNTGDAGNVTGTAALSLVGSSVSIECFGNVVASNSANGVYSLNAVGCYAALVTGSDIYIRNLKAVSTNSYGLYQVSSLGEIVGCRIVSTNAAASIGFGRFKNCTILGGTDGVALVGNIRNWYCKFINCHIEGATGYGIGQSGTTGDGGTDPFELKNCTIKSYNEAVCFGAGGGTMVSRAIITGCTFEVTNAAKCFILPNSGTTSTSFYEIGNNRANKAISLVGYTLVTVIENNNFEDANVIAGEL